MYGGVVENYRSRYAVGEYGVSRRGVYFFIDCDGVCVGVWVVLVCVFLVFCCYCFDYVCGVCVVDDVYDGRERGEEKVG